MGAIERITGHKPSTCPWRAFYDPLVREVLEVFWSIEGGNLGGVIGEDPPGILVDAIGVFKRALDATQAEDDRLRREERETKRAAEAAARASR